MLGRNYSVMKNMSRTGGGGRDEMWDTGACAVVFVFVERERERGRGNQATEMRWDRRGNTGINRSILSPLNPPIHPLILAQRSDAHLPTVCVPVSVLACRMWKQTCCQWAEVYIDLFIKSLGRLTFWPTEKT